MKLNNQMSFDDGDDDLYFRKERSTDALQTLTNPNAIWMPNGIAYDLNCSQASKSTAATMVSKEKIRKRLDVFLYSMDRRMKLLIQQYYEKTSFTFAEDLRKELVSLNCYIKEQSSRIMLH